MMSRFRKPLTWVVAQSILALSLPLAALAAPSEDMTSNGFELPINDVLLVDETRTASAEASTSTFASPLASPSTPVETLPQAAPQAVTPTNNTDEPEMVGALESAKARAIAQKVDSEPGAVLEIEDIVSKNELSPPLMGGVESNNVDQEVIVIDNDEFQLAGTDEVWQELKDEPGMTKISAGAQFPVVVVSSLNSKHNQIGDPLEARLKTDIKIGGKLIAKKGDRVVGHVSSCSKARKMLHAEMSTKRWMRANGAIGLQFDEIVTESGEHLPLVAKPAKRARIVKNINEGRVLGVNDNGEVASPLSTQLKHQAAHLAIRAAASAGGAFSFGIVPAAYGIVGAINPSFAFLHPVGKNVPHRRLKGFAMGVVSGLPGGFLIADSIIRGVDAEIKPGDEFLAQFHQDFTGEASTSASIIPGASQKVHGEVVNPKK
ncbi:hypothetical protein KF728_05565 [Candidatus Obscuribacterales bacterium]|nr:hypothetical protein [Candidatus Obscuribacterales bacterium]